MLDLNLIIDNVKLIDGIWYSSSASKISYPEDGNSTCFELEENSFWFKHRNSVILEVLKNFPPQSGAFFDVGGGNGFVASAIQRKGLPVILIEPGKTGIQNAKKRGIVNLLSSSLGDLQINESSISAIGLFDVLEHIEKEKEFLGQILKILKYDGRMYLTVPAYNLLWSAEDIYAGHYRRYNLETITKIIKEAGFLIEYRTYFFSILPVPVFIFRSLPFKMGFGRNGRNINKKVNDHSKREGITGRILARIWSWELKKIGNRGIISFGGSCLIVAKKSAGKK
jgi:SAM-dependent methyltransferase